MCIVMYKCVNLGEKSRSSSGTQVPTTLVINHGSQTHSEGSVTKCENTRTTWWRVSEISWRLVCFGEGGMSRGSGISDPPPSKNPKLHVWGRWYHSSIVISGVI
jgi:hypothetical protein